MPKRAKPNIYTTLAKYRIGTSTYKYVILFRRMLEPKPRNLVDLDRPSPVLSIERMPTRLSTKTSTPIFQTL